LNFAEILKVSIEYQYVVMRSNVRNWHNIMDLIKVIDFSDEAKFSEFLWDYKKFIRKRDDPMDRWEFFEVLENGVFSNIKLEKLIKSRLQVGEYYYGEEPLNF
jgi:hypothetical protein